MRSHRNIEREVFNYCSETCPAVEGAFETTLDDLRWIVSSNNHDELESLLGELLKIVKDVGTEKLRDALRNAVSDKHVVEAERDDLQRRIEDLESQVDALKDEIQEASA